MSRVAWVRVEGPLGGLFGHGVASTIGGVALDGLGVATSVTGATSTGFQTGPVRVCLDQIYSGSVFFVSFRPELVLDAYISALDDPLAALDQV